MVGCSAGVPLAGIIAAIALSKVNRRIQHRLVAAGLIISRCTDAAKAALDPKGILEWQPNLAATSFGIVDDDVYVNTCVAAEVESRIKHTAPILFEEYTRAGLELHLHPGKTAALISWHGEGTTDATLAVAALVGNFGGIPFQAYGQDFIMPVAGKYKHVGSISRTGDKVCSDLSAKVGAIRSAKQSLEPFVLGNVDIPKDVRVGVAHTHVLPTGEYSSGGWGIMTEAETRRYNRAIVDVYRTIDKSERKPLGAVALTGNVKTDSKVVADLGVLSPYARLAFARIRMFAHIVFRGQTDLLTILHEGRNATKSWMRALEADVAWATAGNGKLAGRT